MFSFKIFKQSKKSRARLGLLQTSHGTVETPALVTVATQAVVKTLTAEQVEAVKSQMLICNTFHLHLKPGEKIVKASGGLHRFMNWSGPIMTDSGGYQVFSFGFGRDENISKIIKGRVEQKIKTGQQPKSIRITSDGVYFRSPLNGDQLFLGPKESIKIQQQLGADIIFAFDECPPPHASEEYVAASLKRTHQWAEICLKSRTSSQALFGIVQGGRFENLRMKSAKFIGALPFDGFGIGGELGGDVAAMRKMLEWVGRALPESKPRHMLGTGHLEDIPAIIQGGADLFDSIVPTHYARHGIAFTSAGRLDLNKSPFLKDKKRLDPRCECPTCEQYTRSYIAHLFRAKEVTAMSLTTMHNLFYFNTLVEKIRERIRKGKI